MREQGYAGKWLFCKQIIICMALYKETMEIKKILGKEHLQQ